jgi:hypothetical protein
LPRWKGRLLNKAGRLTLINSVLSSVVIHHMTVPTEQMGPMKDRQNPACIPVAGAESANGGHCLVNWKGILRPKRLGGLGIIDLSRFNKALRLQWQWKTWKAKDKPWTGFIIPSSETELQLFHACTNISAGNGNRRNFWADKWLQGQAPKELTPRLYILAWRKSISVMKACRGGRWMRGLHRIATTEEIQQFVSMDHDQGCASIGQPR